MDSVEVANLLCWSFGGETDLVAQVIKKTAAEIYISESENAREQSIGFGYSNWGFDSTNERLHDIRDKTVETKGDTPEANSPK